MGRARLAAGAFELKANSAETRRAARTSLRRRDGIALAIFLALTVVMTNPLVLHIADAVQDKQDGLLNVWIIAWVGHALITAPLNLFNANIFYPYQNTLAFSETMLPQGLFALPFNLAFDNTVLSYNLVLLASFFFAAYAMYLFVYDLTRHRGAAIVAGVIFSFNPLNLHDLAQIQLLSLGWLPLAMLFLRRMLHDRNLVRSWRLELRDSILFAVFFSLQSLSSFYYAFLAGFAVVLYVLWFLVTHHASRFTFYATRLTRLTVSAIIIAIAVVPFFLPYLRVQRDLGFQRKIEESEPFSASLALYAQVSPQNVLYGSLLAPRPPIIVGGYPLANLFPGIIAVVLGIIGIAATKSRDRWFYLLLLAFAFLLSLGPRLFLTPPTGTGITLPYRWLYDAFPLMRALRAPVRFDALVMFTLAALAGLGVAKLAIGNWQLAIGIALIALEYLAIPAASIAPVPAGDAIPRYVRWLAQQPPGVTLELPMIANDPTQPLDLTAQYLTTYHWQSTPDGYSGFVPPLRGEIAYEMQSFPNERAISLLQALGVQFVVLHGDQIADWNRVRAAISRVTDLQLAQQFGGDYVYRVAPRAQDASALSARLYLPQPAAPNQNYWAYLIVQNRAPRSFAIEPTDMPQIDARWSDGTAQRVAASMPLVTTSVSVVPVRLNAPPRAGTYRLALNVASRAIGAWNLSGDVVVQDGEPAHQVVLPARVGLSAPLKSAYAPGDVVEINLTWLPLNKIDAYYSTSVRIVDARGNKIVAVDRQPATPTLLWTPGALVPDRFTLPLPRDLAPGEYSIQVLMYQADQGVGALLLDEQDAPRDVTTLGAFTVQP